MAFAALLLSSGAPLKSRTQTPWIACTRERTKERPREFASGASAGYLVARLFAACHSDELQDPDEHRHEAAVQHERAEDRLPLLTSPASVS